MQVAQRAQAARAQVIAKAPQLTGAVAQKAQGVMQDRPGAAVGAGLAVLGLLITRRRRRRREKAKQVRGRSRASRARRWVRALAVLGLLMRRRQRRQREEGS